MARTPDKTPPHDDEMERAALGSMLFDADTVEAANQNHLKAEDFYSRAHQRIYEAILSLDTASERVRPDMQTVVQELRKEGKLDEAGGAAYVASLTSVIPSSANIEYYIRSVLDHSLRRSLLRVASEIGVEAYNESKEPFLILDEIQRILFELGDKRQAFKYESLSKVLGRTFDRIEEVYKTKVPLTGLSTGFDKLNEMTTGFQPSDFIVIGARPSVGKTALALNMASHIAFREQRSVGFFSLEMPDIALAQRLISSEAMVESKKMQNGFIKPEDFRNILRSVGVMSESRLFIVDEPNMRLRDLRSQARKLRSKEEVEIIFIDYLGLIGHENPMLPRHEQMSEISRNIKSLARELKIPIVVLCQLNREMERSGHSQPPTLANIRDSGSIEQDADLVMFLHRKPPEKDKGKKEGEEEQAQPMEGIPVELIIAKQRNGPVGHINLVMQSKYTKFREEEPQRPR
ncbi:MAG: replicative DNA helicase [Treponema sp.]|nr:replicative DNA helicase [Treponema sp.]